MVETTLGFPFILPRNIDSARGATTPPIYDIIISIFFPCLFFLLFFSLTCVREASGGPSGILIGRVFIHSSTIPAHTHLPSYRLVMKFRHYCAQRLLQQPFFYFFFLTPSFPQSSQSLRRQMDVVKPGLGSIPKLFSFWYYSGLLLFLMGSSIHHPSLSAVGFCAIVSCSTVLRLLFFTFQKASPKQKKPGHSTESQSNPALVTSLTTVKHAIIRCKHYLAFHRKEAKYRP